MAPQTHSEIRRWDRRPMSSLVKNEDPNSNSMMSFGTAERELKESLPNNQVLRTLELSQQIELGSSDPYSQM